MAERVADLLGRMTLEEKVAQLTTRWTTLKPLQDAEGTFVPAGAPALLGQGIGQLARPSEIGGTEAGPHVRSARKHAEFTNAVQKWVLENTRLGIPVMFHEEALHGFVAPQATHFPVPLGLGATWNPSLVERAMAVAAKEARARGCQIVLSPVIDLAREPRWGRIEETYGEDPFLVSEFGIAAVRGYQGRSLPLGPGKVFATLKHFAAHGSHEGGINTAPTLVGERQLRAEFLWPFERAVKEAGAYAIMPSYNEIDGVPSHVNRWLLNDVLKGEWGFRGVIVSDYNAISQLASRHKVAADRPQAAIQALEAGNDFETPDPETYGSLVDAVKNGTVKVATIDASVARVLESKFLAGLFENPYVNADEAEAIVKTPEHRALALDAARQAIVLLQNKGNALPLDRTKIKTLAVIGPNAKGVHVGGYSSVQPPPSVDVLAGITAKAGGAVKIVYAEGVKITESEPNWWNDKVVPADPVKNRARIQEALPIAKSADAIVLVLGTNESTSREAWADSHLGDAVGHHPHEPAAGAGRCRGRARQADRRRADPRPAARHPAARREGAGDPRRVVRRPGRRHRHRRDPLRRREPERQAPGDAAAQRRPAAGLLQPQADVVPQLQRLDRAIRCSCSATASATRRSRSPRRRSNPRRSRWTARRRSPWRSRTPAPRPATKSCSSTSATWSAR